MKNKKENTDAFIFEKRSGRVVGRRIDDAGCAAGERKDRVLSAASRLQGAVHADTYRSVFGAGGAGTEERGAEEEIRGGGGNIGMGS